MKIGLQNFRIFKDYQSFNIKPIVLLTGPNNSGKSAFTKLLELLKLGVDNLELKIGRHNLGEFENAVNWQSEVKEFQIDFSSNFKFFKSDLTTKLTFRDGAVKKMEIGDSETAFFEFQIYTAIATHPEDITGTVSWDSLILKINYKKIIDCFFEKDIDIVSGISGRKVSYNKLSTYPYSTDAISFHNYRSPESILSIDYPRIYDSENEEERDGLSFKTSFIDLEYFPTVSLINSVVNKNIKNKNRYALYDIFVNDINVTDSLTDILIKVQDELLIKNFLEIPHYIPGDNFSLILKSTLMLPFNKIKEDFQEHLVKLELFDESVDTLVLKENDIYRLLFNEKLVGWDWSDNDSGFTFFQQFPKQIQLFENYLKKVHFLSAQRGSTERVLLNNGNLEMNRVLIEYENISNKTNSKISPFIEKAFDIFEIKGKFEVKSFENTIMVPYMSVGGKEISFADLGFGFSQIVPIILQIAVSGNKFIGINSNENILIIEEPEANLHPNLQSKLADFFVLAVQTFPNLRLIIESHSEYIIRKLQYLTAKKELDTDATQIYYFNADEFVNEHEPKVKSININQNGILTEDFGPGFYDEAIRLRYDLMKLNSEQLN